MPHSNYSTTDLRGGTQIKETADHESDESDECLHHVHPASPYGTCLMVLCFLPSVQYVGYQVVLLKVKKHKLDLGMWEMSSRVDKRRSEVDKT